MVPSAFAYLRHLWHDVGRMTTETTPQFDSMVLYKSPLCGFCFRVTQFLKRSGIALKMRDVFADSGASAELVSGGGRATVPCLRIEHADGRVEWMYESLAIIEYLSKRIEA